MKTGSAFESYHQYDRVTHSYCWFAAELRRRSFGSAGSDTGTGAGGDLSHNLSESCISNISSSSLHSDPNAPPSKMSTDGQKQPPPYIIPVESQGDGVRVYHPHTPFTPPTTQESAASSKPVYTSGGGGVGSGFDSGEGKKKFVSYDASLGTEAGMTTCSSCQQQVMTNVTYKAGTYAWLMCLLFICCGLVLCCCLIPFFMNRFKDAYHTCPRCNRVLHVEKRKCCK